MTTRIPVSSVQNKWTDAQKVDLSDMNTEQLHKNNNDAAIVQNFLGSGVVLETPTPNVIFDTDPTKLNQTEAALVAAGNFDGTGISPQNQPSDTQQGNQLSIELTGSSVFGRDSTKVLIVGLSFDGTLQYDKFQFHKNEIQATHKHYAQVLTIIFNDFLGNNNCSCTFGGNIVIRESRPYELNRDAKMVAQDVMPDIFIRDLRTADCNKSIFEVIQEGIGSAYDADALNINITGAQPARAIVAGDVTTHLGQKFKATANNIQKVTLLLGVSRDSTAAVEDRFNWDGDLIVAIYPLQTTVECPTAIIPELSIDFDPEDRPLVETSFSQAELRSIGYVLTDTAQPVDFVFTNTKISDPNGITVDKYYAVTLRRSGSAATGDLFLEKGTDRLSDSRFTIFNGSWVDVVEEDLWFQIWSDTAKYASGQAYDRGNGIVSDKVGTDETTGGTIDLWKKDLSFISTGQNVTNTGIIQAVIEESITTQDEKTGNNVFSRQQYVPSFSFVTNDTLNVIKQTSEPLIIGCMADINPKVTTVISGQTEHPGLVSGDLFTILNPSADALSARLIGRKLFPQSSSAYEYRIMRAELCTDGYGDVNGDGYITQADVVAAAGLLNEGINLPATQQRIVDGYVDVLQLLRADVDGDGIITVNDIDLIQNFVNRSSNSFPVGTSFTHLTLQVQTSIGRWDGYYDCCDTIIPDGYARGCVGGIIVNPSTLSEAEREYYGNHGVTPVMDTDNAAFRTVPFVPVTFEIQYQPFWQDWLLALSSNTRELPVAFTYPNSLTSTSCAAPLTFDCQERVQTSVSCDPGRNDFYVPGNLIIDNGGEIVRPDGNPVKQDFEVGVVNLELPAEPFEESSIDVFRSFVADKGDLFTNAGFSAMKYSDCTTVQPEDLALNKIRFNVAIQSFFPSLDGYTLEDGYGVIVDDIIGTYMDHQHGILRLTLKDLDYNPLFQTLVTKIQIVVYLKKGGWNNPVLTVTTDQVSNLAVT
jgi:hypothetical protein